MLSDSVDPLLADPPATILPSLCIAMLVATSFCVPIGVCTTPEKPNVESGTPFVFSRITKKSPFVPPITIFPSGCTATEWPMSLFQLPVPIKIFPVPLNVVSSDPSVESRTTATSRFGVGRVVPVITALPSACNARSLVSSSGPMLTLTFPPTPYDESITPDGRSRTSPKSYPWAPNSTLPATNIFPSACTRTACELVGEIVERYTHHPVCAKLRVPGPVGVQADHEKILRGIGAKHAAYDDDLAVRLQRHPPRRIHSRYGRKNFASGPESRIKIARSGWRFDCS